MWGAVTIYNKKNKIILLKLKLFKPTHNCAQNISICLQPKSIVCCVLNTYNLVKTNFYFLVKVGVVSDVTQRYLYVSDSLLLFLFYVSPLLVGLFYYYYYYLHHLLCHLTFCLKGHNETKRFTMQKSSKAKIYNVLQLIVLDSV